MGGQAEGGLANGSMTENTNGRDMREGESKGRKEVAEFVVIFLNL